MLGSCVCLALLLAVLFPEMVTSSWLRSHSPSGEREREDFPASGIHQDLPL